MSRDSSDSSERLQKKVCKKRLIIIIKNYVLKRNDLEKSFDEEYKGALKNQF